MRTRVLARKDDLVDAYVRALCALSLRDLPYHYAIWVRPHSGRAILRWRVNTRHLADQLVRDLHAELAPRGMHVWAIRTRGVHPWTVQLLGLPLLLVASVIVLPIPRLIIVAVLGATLLGAGCGGRRWMRGGRDDR
jgi:hypothetical protein